MHACLAPSRRRGELFMCRHMVILAVFRQQPAMRIPIAYQWRIHTTRQGPKSVDTAEDYGSTYGVEQLDVHAGPSGGRDRQTKVILKDLHASSIIIGVVPWENQFCWTTQQPVRQPKHGFNIVFQRRPVSQLNRYEFGALQNSKHVSPHHQLQLCPAHATLHEFPNQVGISTNVL